MSESQVLSEGYEIVCPKGEDIESCLEALPIAPFDSSVLNFLADLSASILSHEELRSYPDLATFAFWIRRSSLKKLERERNLSECRIGRGLVLHIAPGNVPLNFAYSLSAGLLSGNANVVRLPSRSFPQVELLCSAIDAQLAKPDHHGVRSLVRIIRYDVGQMVLTRWLSEVCDSRIIWGGDATIAEIRKNPLKPRANEVTFADRYSVCAISARAYLDSKSKARLAQGFFNDTYLYDQNACSAPHLVVWVGSLEESREASKEFWSHLEANVRAKYDLAPTASFGKIVDSYKYAATHAGTAVEMGLGNLVTVVRVPKLEPGIDSWRGSCGLFFESTATSLDQFLGIVNSRYQTLAYFGIEPRDLQQLVLERGLRGIDRVVPIGRTLDFSLDWDGYDLIRTLSRMISSV